MREQTDRDREISRQFRERRKDASRHCKAQHTEFQKDFDYYTPYKQWLEEDVAKLRLENRAAVTFNRIKPFIDAVSGSEVTNRYEPKFLPRTFGDEGHADSLSETVRYLRQQCDAEHEESGAFRHAIICGLGATDHLQAYEQSPEGRTIIERVSPLELLWDPGAQKANFVDLTYVIRAKWIPKQEFQQLFPEHADLFLAQAQNTSDPWGDAATSKLTDRDWMYEGDTKFYDARKGRILVYEYQWKERETFFRVTNPIDGTSADLDQERLDAYRDQLIAQGITPTVQKLPREHFYKAFFGGPHLLEWEDNAVNAFTIKFITCFEEITAEGMKPFGIVRGLRDPQDYVNKTFSQVIHMVSTSPKGAIIHRPGVFPNPQLAATKWAQPNPFIEATDLSEEAIRIVSSAGLSEGLRWIFDSAGQAMEWASGLSLNYFVGAAGDLRRTAGSAINSVLRQNISQLAIPFDSLRRYRKDSARVLQLFIRDYMPEGQLVRIVGNEGTQYVPFMKDWASGEYDIVVEEAPTSPNKKAELSEKLVQTDLASKLMDSGVLMPADLVEVMDFPPNILERARENGRLQSELQKATLELQLTQTLLQLQQMQAMMPPQGDTMGQNVTPPAEEQPVTQ